MERICVMADCRWPSSSLSLPLLPHRRVQNHSCPLGATQWTRCCLVGKRWVLLHRWGYSPGPKCHCSDANGQAGQEWVFQPSSVSCIPLARMRNASFSLIFTKVCGVGAHWHSAAACSPSKPVLEHPPGFVLGQVLPRCPADTMDVRSHPDWMLSSYSLCSIRVQISFALFSFGKKGVCFVYPCKCQKQNF